MLRAARFLHGADMRFARADLADAAATLREDGPIDVLIMINWPHTVAFEEIASAVTAMREAPGVNYLLIDTVKPGRGKYRFAHGVQDLERLGDITASVDAGDAIRDLQLVRLR